MHEWPAVAIVCSFTMVECDARKYLNYFQELQQSSKKLSCQENEHIICKQKTNRWIQSHQFTEL